MESTIFITGSSSGLGRAAARLFRARGWRVIATMRNPEKEKELAGLPGVVRLALDITKPEQIERAASEAIASGGVDVVFNNAGYGMAGPLEGLSDEQILRMVSNNLMGAIRTTKAFIPISREARGAVHQHDFDRRPDHGSLQLDLPRHQVGSGGLEREHGLRAEPTRHRHQDGVSGRDEDRLLHPVVRHRPASRLRRARRQGDDHRDRSGADEDLLDARGDCRSRLRLGDEAFRKAMGDRFFGAANQEGA
jgi:hypothetical protein